MVNQAVYGVSLEDLLDRFDPFFLEPLFWSPWGGPFFCTL